MGHGGKKDFFVSYRSADEAWASWIAWQLEEAGYTTFFQGWDFRPGQNFVNRMQEGTTRSDRTLVVISPAYFQSDFTQAEWYAAFKRDPAGQAGTLLPVKVESCDLEGLLRPIVHIDLVGVDEEEARHRLLEGVAQTRAKPSTAPPFWWISSCSDQSWKRRLARSDRAKGGRPPYDAVRRCTRCPTTPPSTS